MEEFPELKLEMHNVSTQNYLSIFSVSGRAWLSVTNIETIDRLKSQVEDKTALRDYHEKLHALVEVQCQALESLVNLQQGWVDHVEADAATKDELRHFKEKLSRFRTFCHEHHESQDASLLSSQLAEVTQGIAEAQSSFEAFSASNSDRNAIFENFRADPTNEYLDQFKSELLQHLSSTIVVKESRTRYQKEQFDRLLIAAQLRGLKNKSASMDHFCKEYSQLIEHLISESHNHRCPKIQANYDDFAEQTLRPLNSTIFYYFFSGDRMKRNFAQWMLASARYPNEKLRRAYMRFFA